MSENSSNSCTSSNCGQHNLPAGKSHDETYESIMKRPSMPPRSEKKHRNLVRDIGRRRWQEETTSSGNIESGGEEAEDEEEIEFSMGKLIRQASLKTSDSLPQTGIASMGETTMSSDKSKMKQEFESRKLERLRPRRITSQLKSQKSLNDLQWKELQSFKGLGLQASPLSEESPPATKEEDMKAQIKFWARAVASNVR